MGYLGCMFSWDKSLRPKKKKKKFTSLYTPFSSLSNLAFFSFSCITWTDTDFCRYLDTDCKWCWSEYWYQYFCDFQWRTLVHEIKKKTMVCNLHSVYKWLTTVISAIKWVILCALDDQLGKDVIILYNCWVLLAKNLLVLWQLLSSCWLLFTFLKFP